MAAKGLGKEDQFVKPIVIVGAIVLVALSARYLVENRLDLLIQTTASLVFLLAFFALRGRLKQDLASHLILTATLVIHNLGLYSTRPLGLRYDHYTHFLGGFTVAIITDRIFEDKLSKVKRFGILVMASLGVGALLEIVQWLDAYIVPGLAMFRADDISNTIKDMMSDGLGGIAMGIVSLFRNH